MRTQLRLSGGSCPSQPGKALQGWHYLELPDNKLLDRKKQDSSLDANYTPLLHAGLKGCQMLVVEELFLFLRYQHISDPQAAAANPTVPLPEE